MKDKIIPEANLSEQDFYNQACEYFRYHAAQRTTMINYYIVVLGACLTLYGNFVASTPLVAMLIAIFMLVVSVLFYNMDLRTRFDVKMSQNVICEFERRYEMDKTHQRYCLGVFSNEDHIFELYDVEFQDDLAFRALQKLHKKMKKHPGKGFEKDFDEKFHAFASNHPDYAPEVLAASLSGRKIPHLSSSIRILFFCCMAASGLGILTALYIFVLSLV